MEQEIDLCYQCGNEFVVELGYNERYCSKRCCDIFRADLHWERFSHQYVEM